MITQTNITSIEKIKTARLTIAQLIDASNSIKLIPPQLELIAEIQSQFEDTIRALAVLENLFNKQAKSQISSEDNKSNQAYDAQLIPALTEDR